MPQAINRIEMTKNKFISRIFINFILILSLACNSSFPDFDGNFPQDMIVTYEPPIEKFEGFVGDTVLVKVSISHDFLKPSRLTEINEVYFSNNTSIHIQSIFKEDINGLPSPLEFELKHVFKQEDVGRNFEYGFQHMTRIIPEDNNGYTLRGGVRSMPVITKSKP